MIVTARELVERARKEEKAVGAFNTSTLEVTRAILLAAEESKTPVIIETSEGEAGFLGYEEFAAVVEELVEEMTTDIAINLDHGKSFDSVSRAIDAGYSAVHIDGSKMERSENIALTRKIVDYAHERHVSVEGEFNDIGGASKLHSDAYKVGQLTDVAEALEFIEKTGIDIFAGSYGNIHGVYENEPHLDIERIREIADKSGVLLSLHGGSGIPEDQIKAAVAAGISKINVNTELRLKYREAMSRVLKDNPEEVVPYNLLPPVIEEVKKVVLQKIALFGLGQ